MTLLELKNKQLARIQALPSGKIARQRLMGLGIIPGAELEIIHHSATGPLIIKINSSRVALGRGVASQITVEQIDGSDSKQGN